MRIDDRQRIVAELIGETNANPRPSDGEMDNFAQSRSAEKPDVEAAVGQYRRGSPSAHPLLPASGLSMKRDAGKNRKRGKSNKARTEFQHLRILLR